MQEREKFRRDQPLVGTFDVTKRLRMIEVNFGHATWCDIIREKLERAADGEPNVMQSALVAATSRIANDERQDVESEMIAFRPTHGAGDDESTVTATKVEYDRGVAFE